LLKRGGGGFIPELLLFELLETAFMFKLLKREGGWMIFLFEKYLIP
jgi:hypothetical protein